jgi:hypothetical protein
MANLKKEQDAMFRLSRVGLPVSASQLTEVIQHEIDGAITELAPREWRFFCPSMRSP